MHHILRCNYLDSLPLQLELPSEEASVAPRRWEHFPLTPLQEETVFLLQPGRAGRAGNALKSPVVPQPPLWVFILKQQYRYCISHIV